MECGDQKRVTVDDIEIGTCFRCLNRTHRETSSEKKTISDCVTFRMKIKSNLEIFNSLARTHTKRSNNVAECYHRLSFVFELKKTRWGGESNHRPNSLAKNGRWTSNDREKKNSIPIFFGKSLEKRIWWFGLWYREIAILKNSCFIFSFSPPLTTKAWRRELEKKNWFAVIKMRRRKRNNKSETKNVEATNGRMV